MTLTEFLLARIAEDETAARWCYEERWRPQLLNGTFRVVDVEHEEVVCEMPTEDMAGGHIARWDPARVLAECEAKRRIIGHERPEHGDDAAYGGAQRMHEDVLTFLAQPYADHPDFDPAWTVT